MQIAIIDNDTRHLQALQRLLSRHDVTVIHRDDMSTSFSFLQTCNAIVISGSAKYAVKSKYPKARANFHLEQSFVRDTAIPILGICAGFQVIATAYGGTLEEQNKHSIGTVDIKILHDDPIFTDIKNLQGYKWHKWKVIRLPADITLLARSEHGCEVIKHTQKLIYGFQFHPEALADDKNGSILVRNFLRLAEVYGS